MAQNAPPPNIIRFNVTFSSGWYPSSRNLERKYITWKLLMFYNVRFNNSYKYLRGLQKTDVQMRKSKRHFISLLVQLLSTCSRVHSYVLNWDVMQSSPTRGMGSAGALVALADFQSSEDKDGKEEEIDNKETYQQPRPLNPKGKPWLL